MAQIDVEERQLVFKIVYCGPPLAGKTTNLIKLHELVDDKNRGRLMTLDGSNDRTLFFDLLPIFFRVSGLSVRVKVYTVPGQPAHKMTRRAVLKGADGVVFVADSAPGKSADNQLSFEELKANLGAAGLSLESIALVTQFNKRDLGEGTGCEAFADEETEEATAAEGQGVLETFLLVASKAWDKLDKEANLGDQFAVSRQKFADALSRHIRRP